MSDESQYKECEFCKNDIPILNFDLHGATCRRHHFKCPKCGEFVSLSGREDHEQMNHSIERCEKCGTTYKPIDKTIHLSVCRSASVSCEFCDSSVIRKDFSEHQDACGARTERCEKCDKYVMLRETTHVCRAATPHDFTERIGTMFSSDLERRDDLFFYRDLPFPDPPNLSRNTEFTNTIRATVPLQTTHSPFEPLQTTHSPIEPPNFVSLSSLEDRLPQDGDSNSTGLQLEPERDPTAPCEFCGNQVPLLALDGHQEQCKFRRYVTETETKYCPSCKQVIPEMELEEHSRICLPRNKSEKFNKSIGSHYSRRNKLEPEPEPSPLHSSSMVPCEFCDQMFDFSEILTHQTICPQRNVPMEFGPISVPERKCSFCNNYFKDSEIEFHRKYCISKPRTEVQAKCQFCLKTFSLEKLPIHLKICPKKPEQVLKPKCSWCLQYFEEELLSDHENTCSYRYVRGRRGIHDVELPFGDNKPILKKEREKIETIDNKCPFCRFPQTAFEMENHKNSCAKNPKYRKRDPSYKISPSLDELDKPMSPEFLSSRPEPRQEPIKIESKTHEKVPKPETKKNPFLRDQSSTWKLQSTHRTMDTIPNEFNDSRYSNKQEPYKSTKTTTTTTPTKHPPFNLYSQTDPSPKQQKYEHKHQQTDTIKNPIKKSDVYSHRRPSPSPTELFRNKTETNLAFNDLISDNNNLTFIPPSNQFKFELKGPLVPLTNPLLIRSNKPSTIPILHTPSTENKPHLTPTQDTSFPFQLPTSKPRSGPILSSSLPRAHYTDTNTSYKPEPAPYKPEVSSYIQKPNFNKPEPAPYKSMVSGYKPESTPYKPELFRKSSPSQPKYARHTSPRNVEMNYSDSPTSGYESKRRDISYPPRYKSEDSYTRTSSSGTETIVEPSHSIATQRKTPTDFSHRYKQTSNYK